MSVLADMLREPMVTRRGANRNGDATGAVDSSVGGTKSGGAGKGEDGEGKGNDEGGDGGGGGGGGGGSNSPDNSSFPLIRDYEITFPGDQVPRIAESYYFGDDLQITIHSGDMFLGRKMGGGTRDQIYGTRQYGSGYPGATIDRGVAGRDFPFWFWPVAWGGVASDSNATYLHTTEYGAPDNTSRPGGIMMTAKLVSIFTPLTNSSSTFHFISDNTTVQSMIQGAVECAVFDNVPTPYNASSPTAPRPEQAIQYYRGSTAVLTVEGYNNTSIFQANGTEDVPLPWSLDMDLLGCLNDTIGGVILLVDNTSNGQIYSPSNGPIALVYLLWVLIGMIMM